MPVLEDSGLVARIDRALRAYQLRTMPVEVGIMRKCDLVIVAFPNPAGGRFPCRTYWNFCAALTYRAFKALRAAPHPALREVLARHESRMETFELLLRHQFVTSIREEGGLLEIRTSFLAGETSLETQPWVALGLVTDSDDD